MTKETQEKLVFEMDRLSYIVNTPYAQTIVNKIPYYVDKIFSIVDDALKDTSKTFITSNIISNFINIRAKMYQDPISYSVEKMASTLGFTETYFGIKYKEFFNLTPSQDRKIKIVELIKTYLETTNYSLETIGEFCKIQSTAHLINLFKSIANITPHQYRKNCRNKH